MLFPFLRRLGEEQPFRLVVRTAIKRFSRNLRIIERWDAVDRPQYLTGILAAADIAKDDGIDSVYAIEFGVASGKGLLLMQEYAAMVESTTGVHIRVAGFDTGKGLPPTAGDYRDHPDYWREGDYPMINIDRLTHQLMKRTELILGDVRNTVPTFVRRQECPVGFLAMDLDLYSSTINALQILTFRGSQKLRQTLMYFDDVLVPQAHRFGGERLAISDFNRSSEDVKIDRCYWLQERIFRDLPWIQKMYTAHDLTAVANYRPAKRPPQVA